MFVGDLFTKGPAPGGVWSIIRSTEARAVLGNHDDRLLRIVDGQRRRDAHGAAVVEALMSEEWAAWLRSLPLFLDVGAFTLVHAGLHPSGNLEDTTRAMALTMRRWPRLQDPECPRWHEVYAGERRVVFGHDAAGGLVRRERNGEPWLIGLDSGCVYGGQLSGYVIEEDRVVSVPALRAYCPVR